MFDPKTLKEKSEYIKFAFGVIKEGIKVDHSAKIMLGLGAVGGALAVVKGAGLLGIVSGATLVLGFSQGFTAGIQKMMEEGNITGMAVGLPESPFNIKPEVS